MYTVQLLGVAVFACSGCVAAGRKQLDLLGVIIVGLVTATGGGTLRDLLLDRNPVFWIEDPTYLIVATLAALLTTLYARFLPIPHRLLLTADALGLSLFTISGTQLAEATGQTGLIALTMGVLTGAAGGAIRDLLCNEIPLIMRSAQLYATAAVAGAATYILLHKNGASPDFAAAAGMAVCALLRFASMIFNIRLPVPRSDYHRE